MERILSQAKVDANGSGEQFVRRHRLARVLEEFRELVRKCSEKGTGKREATCA